MTDKPVEKIKSCLRDVGADRPSRHEAEEAVRTLLRWIGEKPEREGLIDTPKRVVDAYTEFFQGYEVNADAVLGRTFADVDSYGEMVLVKDIQVTSFCEHHILPIIGTAHIAYIANERLVGLSKLGRLVDVYAKRLQTQEGLTAQILLALETVLKPVGAAVIIESEHQCMTLRGVKKPGTITVTEKVVGSFAEDPQLRARLYQLLNR